MAETSFDLIVIGAGPGGYVAAIRAAQLGMRVACVEKQYLGGTCLNVGCIPSKALLDTTEKLVEARTAFGREGIKINGDISVDLPTMMARKDKVVQTMVSGVGGLFRKNKVEHVRGAARITGPGTVEVRDGVSVLTLHGRRILIATGSEPIALPALPFDGKRVLSSTEALALPRIPGRLVVVGAGAIGLELGSVWNRLGTQVLVLEFMDRILPGMDREMTGQLQRLLEKQGLTFRLKTSAQSVAIEGDRPHVTWASGEQRGTEECDHVLVAIGRRPYTAGLGLEELRVAMDRKGFIQVDKSFQTNVPGIYAIGDCVGGAMLAHKASEEGVAAVEMMAGQAGHVNYRAVADIVYTSPELASVGLSEEEAVQEGHQVRIGKFPFTANGRARCLDATEGLVKVIGDAATDRLLGMHILHARASELIAEGVTAMEFASSVEDIARAVHAHPTLPEAIKEAALGVEKRMIHL